MIPKPTNAIHRVNQESEGCLTRPFEFQLEQGVQKVSDILDVVENAGDSILKEVRRDVFISMDDGEKHVPIKFGIELVQDKVETLQRVVDVDRVLHNTNEKLTDRAFGRFDLL